LVFSFSSAGSSFTWMRRTLLWGGGLHRQYVAALARPPCATTVTPPRQLRNNIQGTRSSSNKDRSGTKEDTLPPRLPTEVIDLNTIGEQYHELGMLHEARHSFQAAMKIVTVQQPSHPQLATILNNLASVLLAERKYDEAEQLFKRAVEIRAQHYQTPSHIQVAVVLDNLGAMYMQQHKLDDAISVFQTVLNIREGTQDCATNDDDDDDCNREYQKRLHSERLAVTENNLALAYYAKGDLQNAERLFEAATGHWGSNITIWKNTAACCAKLLKWGNAEKAYQKVLDLLLEDLLPEDAKVQQIVSALSNSQQQRQSCEEGTTTPTTTTTTTTTTTKKNL